MILLLPLTCWIRQRWSWERGAFGGFQWGFFGLSYRWGLLRLPNSQLPRTRRIWMTITIMEFGIDSLYGWWTFYSMSENFALRRGLVRENKGSKFQRLVCLGISPYIFGVNSALKLWGMDCTSYDWVFWSRRLLGS